jgi:predicted site-specific integrase-resolvase
MDGSVDRLVFTDEATVRLGVSYGILKRYVQSGSLAPPRVIGGRIAWKECEILDFVERLPKLHPRGRGRPRKDGCA